MRLSGADRGPSHQEVAGSSPTWERQATSLGPPDGRAPAEDPGGVLALPSPRHSWQTSEGAMQPLFHGHGSLESRMNQTDSRPVRWGESGNGQAWGIQLHPTPRRSPT